MSRTTNMLSPEQLAQALELKAEGLGIGEIGRRIGASYYQVRREIDPEKHERKLAQTRQHNAENRLHSVRAHVGEHHDAVRNPEYDPHRNGAPVYASPFAELLGEPPIGRRAIDTRSSA